jgi:hypothetical protein
MLQGCYKYVTERGESRWDKRRRWLILAPDMLQGCYRNVTNMLHRCFREERVGGRSGEGGGFRFLGGQSRGYYRDVKRM